MMQIKKIQKLRNLLFCHKVVDRAATFADTEILKLQITKTKILWIAKSKKQNITVSIKSPNLLFHKLKTIKYMKPMSL